MNPPTKTSPPASATTNSDKLAILLEQYSCGTIHFAGSDNASYERHLVFDNVINSALACDRERFEAVANSVRDVLAQRWVRTEETYPKENPKRVYYLSMEFLIGRSLANNVTNLLLDLADIFTEISRGIDKWLWFVEAHTQVTK